MGGVGIALDDTLADPFVNPAKTTRVRTGTLFASPYLHTVSAGFGGGRTLPVGGIGSVGDWSGAAVFAVQTISHGGGRAVSERTAGHQYRTVSVGHRMSQALSLG